MSNMNFENEALWYVIYTYSGYENKVKSTLEKIVENRRLQDEIQEIIIPMEEEIEIKDGKQKSSIKKVFPGYVLVKMVMTDKTWYVVKGIKGVFNFVGPDDKPVPLTDVEMENMGIGQYINVDLEVGDLVRLKTSAFEGRPAEIEEINIEKGKAKVKISMFNRITTALVDLDKIEKI